MHTINDSKIIYNCCSNKQLTSSPQHCLVFYFNGKSTISRYGTKYNTVSLCNSSTVIPSEGTNSNIRLSEQLWAEQLRTWYNLDLLHLSLCIGSYSPRGNDQQSVTVGTALSRTDPNNIELLSSKQRRWASHQKTLSAIGAAYSIRLIRALFYLH